RRERHEGVGGQGAEVRGEPVAARSRRTGGASGETLAVRNHRQARGEAPRPRREAGVGGRGACPQLRDGGTSHCRQAVGGGRVGEVPPTVPTTPPAARARPT